MTTETLHHVTKTSKHNPTFFKVTIYFIWPLDIWAEYSLFKYITYFCSIVYSSPHVYINSYILFISNSHASHYDEEYIYIYVHLLVICVWWCMHVVCVLQYIDIQMFVHCPLDDMFVYSGHFQRGNTTLRQIKLSVNE